MPSGYDVDMLMWKSRKVESSCQELNLQIGASEKLPEIGFWEMLAFHFSLVHWVLAICVLLQVFGEAETMSEDSSSSSSDEGT